MPETLIASRTTGYLLDGKFMTDGRPVEIRSPYDNKVVGIVTFAGATQVEAAIAGAVRCFEVTRKLPAFERQRVLREAARQIGLRHEEFARSIALESGKPIKTARAEVDRAVYPDRRGIPSPRFAGVGCAALGNGAPLSRGGNCCHHAV